MEREAAERYAQLAVEAERRTLPSLAGVFRRLEGVEREHLSRVSGSKDVVEDGPEGELAFAWTLGYAGPEETPRTPVEDLDVLTPWGVLDLALINEERAFAFYARVAAKTSDPDARALAETLAAEELEHVAWLRLHRLKAWPEERETRESLWPKAGLLSPNASLDALRTLARQMEEEMTARLERAGARSDGSEAGSNSRDVGSEEEERGMSGLREEVRRIDLLYRSWISVCEQTKDEGVLRFAQGEADKTLGMLARARDFLARARR
jgi:rubrerythrin